MMTAIVVLLWFITLELLAFILIGLAIHSVLEKIGALLEKKEDK